MWLGHHFQGQKVKVVGAGPRCGGLQHSLLQQIYYYKHFVIIRRIYNTAIWLENVKNW